VAAAAGLNQRQGLPPVGFPSLIPDHERCEQEAASVDSLAGALELAIQLESSELDALGHRIIGSLRSELPEGAARPSPGDDHCRQLVRPLGRFPI
jgi:hypothetical protein